MEINWDEYNIKEDAAIDPAQLDVCWLEQPNLVAKYGKALARAEMEAKQTAEDVKSIRSDIIIAISADPSPLGDGVKPTAPVVEAYYRQDADYRRAKARMIKAEATAERLRQCINALYNRRTALENLVRLHGQEWFAGPRAPRDLVAEWEQNTKHRRASTNVKEHTKRRRTK